MRLTSTLWAFIALSALIKLMIGFFGTIFRRYASFMFLIDLFISFFIVIGVYFLLEDMHRKVYMAYGHFVVIDCCSFFVMSVLFSLTSFLKLKRTINGFILSAVIMIIIDSLLIKAIEYIWVSNPLLFQ